VWGGPPPHTTPAMVRGDLFCLDLGWQVALGRHRPARLVIAEESGVFCRRIPDTGLPDGAVRHLDLLLPPGRDLPLDRLWPWVRGHTTTCTLEHTVGAARPASGTTAAVGANDEPWTLRRLGLRVRQGEWHNDAADARAWLAAWLGVWERSGGAIPEVTVHAVGGGAWLERVLGALPTAGRGVAAAVHLDVLGSAAGGDARRARTAVQHAGTVVRCLGPAPLTLVLHAGNDAGPVAADADADERSPFALTDVALEAALAATRTPAAEAAVLRDHWQAGAVTVWVQSP
jgi:hypothetical protein